MNDMLSAIAPDPFDASGRRLYGRLRLEAEGMWSVEEIAPHVAMRLKQIFPRIPKTATAPFLLTDTDATCADLLWFMERYPLAVTDEAAGRLSRGKSRFEDRRAEFERILLPSWKPSATGGFRPGMQPYPFQAQAVALTLLHGRLLLLDDVGLGKTVSALGVLCDPRCRPAAVVVQSHLADQWVDEYVDTFTDLTAHIIKGTKPYDLPWADIYIFKYSNIAGWVDIAAQGVFKAVVYDEVQELRRGTETAKGAAAKVFSDHAAVRLGLTATPVYNYGSEIWQVVNFIDPGILGTWHEFLIEWCVSGGGHWVVRDPAALGSYLREMQLVLRRTEAEVGGQMPPVNTITHLIAHDEEKAAESEALAHQLAIKVTRGTFIERGKAALELDALVRHTTGVAKAKHVAAFVRVLLDGKVPVVLTGWHRDVYEVWLDELEEFAPVMFTGSETTAAKNRTKRAFIEGATDLLIISLRSGAGLDGLQRRGSTLVFGELDWSPLVHKQIIGRLRRPGQTRQVDAIYLHSNFGSDPPMIELLGVKASQARGIVDPMAGVETIHSDESRIQLLARQFLDRRAAAAPSTITAGAFGDPPPGRSALDQRRAAG